MNEANIGLHGNELAAWIAAEVTIEAIKASNVIGHPEAVAKFMDAIYAEVAGKICDKEETTVVY